MPTRILRGAIPMQALLNPVCVQWSSWAFTQAGQNDGQWFSRLLLLVTERLFRDSVTTHIFLAEAQAIDLARATLPFKPLLLSYQTRLVCRVFEKKNYNTPWFCGSLIRIDKLITSVDTKPFRHLAADAAAKSGLALPQANEV